MWLVHDEYSGLDQWQHGKGEIHTLKCAAKKKKTDKKKKVVKAYAGMSVSRDMATNPQSVKSQKQASNSAANRGKGLMTILTAAIKGNKPTFVYKGNTYDTQAVKDKLAKQKTASS